jgi:hypothetical protein
LPRHHRHPPVGLARPGENATQTNGLATASRVLGILSLVLFFTFVIAWVLGILAVTSVLRSRSA